MRAPRTIIVAVLGLALIAIVWVLSAPTQIGGSTSYATTEGISMLPHLHTGDLAVLRTQSSYEVGEAALYKSPVLGRSVLHRIVAIHDDRYFFKGDNNDFVDPGSVPKSAIVGTLWFHVPHVGGWVGWLGTPFHSALFAAAAALVLLLGGRTRRLRRERRRGAADGPASQPALDRAGTLRQLHLSGWFPPLVVTLIIGGLLLVVGLAQPLHKSVGSPGAYRHLGSFSYAGRLTKPNAAYPSGVALTGQVLPLDLIHTMQVRFRYQFSTRLTHNVHGTIALKARVSAQTSYHQTFTVRKAVAFRGDRTSADGTVDLTQARSFFDQLSAQTGSVGADYSVDLLAIVRITGIVGAKHIHETFAPALPFSLNHQFIAINVPVTSTGSTYLAPTASDLTVLLNPDQPGSIPRRAANTLSFTSLHLDVMRVRLLGLALTLIGLLGLVALMILRRQSDERSEQDLIQSDFGNLIVPALSINRDPHTPVELADFHSLVRLAQRYEQLILHEHRGDEDIYAVEEDGRLYVYRIGPNAPKPLPSPAPVAAHPALLSARPARVQRRTRLRALALLAVLSIGLMLVVSFTASNTVPVTYAGTSKHNLNLSQLAPSRCAGLNLTKLIVTTSSTSSVTGSSSSELILGPNHSGTVVYNAGSGDDCIVAGGGRNTTNQINGGGGNDICIGAPNAHNTFTNCDKQYN